MDNYKESFIAFMSEHDIKFTDHDERAVTLRFSSDSVPGDSVRVLVIFDSDNANKVHLMSSFLTVPEGKYTQILMACNEANSQFRWVKFYISSQMKVVVDCDAVLDIDSAGSECTELAFRMSDIIDKAFPTFMKAIYS